MKTTLTLSMFIFANLSISQSLMQPAVYGGTPDTLGTQVIAHKAEIHDAMRAENGSLIVVIGQRYDVDSLYRQLKSSSLVDSVCRGYGDEMRMNEEGLQESIPSTEDRLMISYHGRNEGFMLLFDKGNLYAIYQIEDMDLHIKCYLYKRTLPEGYSPRSKIIERAVLLGWR